MHAGTCISNDAHLWVVVDVIIWTESADFFFKIVGSQMLATSIIFLTLLKPTIKIITIMELWMQLVVARFVQLEYSAIG